MFILWHHLRDFASHVRRPVQAFENVEEGFIYPRAFHSEGEIRERDGYSVLETYDLWRIPLPYKKTFYRMWSDQYEVAWVDLAIFNAWPTTLGEIYGIPKEGRRVVRLIPDYVTTTF